MIKATLIFQVNSLLDLSNELCQVYRVLASDLVWRYETKLVPLKRNLEGYALSKGKTWGGNS